MPDASVYCELSGYCGIHFFLRSEHEGPIKLVGALSQKIVKAGEKRRLCEDDGAPYGQLFLHVPLEKTWWDGIWGYGPS